MKAIFTILSLAILNMALGQGKQTIISVIPAVSPGSLAGARIITPIGNNRVAAFFNKSAFGNNLAQAHMVVNDLDGNLILATGIASDSTMDILNAGGCRDGGYYIVAEHKNVYANYATGQTIFIKLDSLGQVSWSKALSHSTGGTGIAADYAATVLEDEYGNFYVNQDRQGISSLVSYSANGNYQWGLSYGFDTLRSPLYSMCLTGDSGIMCVGRDNQNKVFSVINYNGSTRWVKNYYNGHYSQFGFIHKTADGGYITGGMCENAVDSDFSNGSALCKLNSNGDVLWEKRVAAFGCGKYITMADAIENADGTFTGLVSNMGFTFMVFTGNGDLLGNIGAYPSYTLGSLKAEGSNFSAIGYPAFFNGLFTQDTMYYAFFRANNPAQLCTGISQLSTGQYDISDSNVVVATTSPLHLSAMAQYPAWGLHNVAVNYATHATLVCTPAIVTQADNVPPLEFKLYPNPASTHVEVDIAAGSRADVLKLFDVAGRQVMQMNITGETTAFDVSHFNEGIYLVRLENSGLHVSSVQKIAIQK